MTQLMFMGNIILNMITLISTKSIQKDITELKIDSILISFDS